MGDDELAATSKEFDVLALLDATRGAVVSRERLINEVWDENWFGSTKTLDATVGRLRQKLEDAAAPARSPPCEAWASGSRTRGCVTASSPPWSA